MSNIALGVWVAFLKQPALPGEAPQTKQVCSLKRPAAIFFIFLMFSILPSIYSAFFIVFSMLIFKFGKTRRMLRYALRFHEIFL
jgi:hypothetical protein